MPGGFNAIADIVARRAAIANLTVGVASESSPGQQVDTEDQSVPGLDGEPNVRVRIYRPADATGDEPGLFFIHGGGMVIGSIEIEEHVAIRLCTELGAVVVSTSYRKAPENRHPAQLNDCYAALVWMADHADDIGFDRNRLAIYGASAGGNLTIAVALTARDRGFPAVSFIMPVYPMLDDRNETGSSRAITGVGIWDRSANVEAWEWFLGGQQVDEFAAPSRAADLSGLPPTFIDVGDVDLFRDEDIEFATRLVQAGVPTELHVYPGAYHGSETFAPDAELSRRIWSNRLAALERAFGPRDAERSKPRI
ncbi:MAG: alpha/beta hydrolase [Gordonia sp.]|nr:alpha/beta hydrolase [Gordonia sp. (in: high G+C Gram-positive bacteria)]